MADPIIRPASYHVHSTWSDGRKAIAEMIKAAENAGLEEIGLSDHYVLTPYSDTNAHEWSMPLDQLNRYVDEVRSLADKSAIEVKLGVEADYFPETWEQLAKILARHPFDYVIGSVHYVERFPIDCAAHFWEDLSQEQINSIYRGYWQRMTQMAETGIYDFAGHLDLPKKFGFRPTETVEENIRATLEAIATADMAIELNTSGWDKTCAEPYPEPDIIAMAREKQIPVLVSADAHAPQEIARHFDRALALLRRAGVSHTVRFRQRQRLTVPLP